MATNVRDLLRRAFRARDQAELANIEKEIPPEEGERGDLTGDPASTGGPLEQRDDHIHIHLPQRRDEAMPKTEPHFDRRDDRRRDFGGRRQFTDPGPDPGEEPGESGGGGFDIQEVLEEIMQRLEALEDQVGAGHGGGTGSMDRGRDDRRRDGWHHFSRRGRDRGRGRDRDDCNDDDDDRRRDSRDARDEEGTGEEGPKTLSVEEAKGEHDIPGELEMEAPSGTTSDSRRRAARDKAPVRDSAALANIFRDTLGAAEILAPGIELPIFDVRTPETKTRDCMCELQRTALDLARNTPELRREIEALTGGEAISKLTTDELRTVFRAAALFKGHMNNSGIRVSRDIHAEQGYGGGTGVRSKLRNPADVNANNRKYYASQYNKPV